MTCGILRHFAAKTSFYPASSVSLISVDVLKVVDYVACFVAEYDKAYKLVVFPRTKGSYVLFERSVC